MSTNIAEIYLAKKLRFRSSGVSFMGTLRQGKRLGCTYT